MVDRVYLVGAEDVERAGRNIASAADSMERILMSVESSLAQHASRTEAAFRGGLPAEQLELLGLVALVNWEAAMLNAAMTRYGEPQSDPNTGSAMRLAELIEKVRGA